MWDDLPKKMSAGTKTLIVFLVIVILAGISYIGYTIYKAQQTPCCQSSSSPIASAKISGSPGFSPSPTISSSPTISPSPSGSVNLQIPDGETLVMQSTADTNGDNKDETLVITKMTSGKYHAYILSSEGKSLFDNKELDRKPVRIAMQIYDASKETYLSWMLIFTENSGDLVFIHWSGTKYEIPQSVGL